MAERGECSLCLVARHDERERCSMFRSPSTMSAGMLIGGLCPAYARRQIEPDDAPFHAPAMGFKFHDRPAQATALFLHNSPG